MTETFCWAKELRCSLKKLPMKARMTKREQELEPMPASKTMTSMKGVSVAFSSFCQSFCLCLNLSIYLSQAQSNNWTICLPSFFFRQRTDMPEACVGVKVLKAGVVHTLYSNHTEWLLDHRNRLHVRILPLKQNWQQLPSILDFFFWAFSALLRNQAINTQCCMSFSAHVNLTENTIASALVWNMFSHA